MKKQTFINKVQKELYNIKEKATPEEIKRLKYSQFDETDPNRCVYGLLAGDSYSKRARQIQNKQFASLSGWRSDKFEDQTFGKGTAFTALEKYLLMVSKKVHKEIFRYIKGKTETIDLNVI
jgi:hypothetical protein